MFNYFITDCLAYFDIIWQRGPPELVVGYCLSARIVLVVFQIGKSADKVDK